MAMGMMREVTEVVATGKVREAEAMGMMRKRTELAAMDMMRKMMTTEGKAMGMMIDLIDQAFKKVATEPGTCNLCPDLLL